LIDIDPVITFQVLSLLFTTKISELMVERDPDLIHYFKSYKKEITKG